MALGVLSTLKLPKAMELRGDHGRPWGRGGEGKRGEGGPPRVSLTSSRADPFLEEPTDPYTSLAGTGSWPEAEKR